MLCCSDGTEIITHTELRVSDAEQIVVKAVRKPIHVTFVFFLISLWIGKNVNESFVPVNAFYFIRIAIVCMKYLFSITTKLFFTVLSYVFKMIFNIFIFAVKRVNKNINHLVSVSYCKFLCPTSSIAFLEHLIEFYALKVISINLLPDPCKLKPDRVVALC